jgi:hypothetical protein
MEMLLLSHSYHHDDLLAWSRNQTEEVIQRNQGRLFQFADYLLRHLLQTSIIFERPALETSIKHLRCLEDPAVRRLITEHPRLFHMAHDQISQRSWQQSHDSALHLSLLLRWEHQTLAAWPVEISRPLTHTLSGIREKHFLHTISVGWPMS